MKDRLIEKIFPIEEISKESTQEKGVQLGHISSMHFWWARRPLAVSRATSYAALILPPKNIEEWGTKPEFISKFSKWDNSLNYDLISKARKDILDDNEGNVLKVLDPFSGGGAIPLESIRLGCDTYANDYNPVATFLLKCTLEFPQLYNENRNNGVSIIDVKENKLANDIKKWCLWILEESKKDLEKYYPLEDGLIPYGYIWARTIPCQNPSCGATIPLLSQFWLIKNGKRKISLYPQINSKSINFKIIGTGYEPIPDSFEPSKGTISKAIAVCPVCGINIKANTTRKLFQEGKSGQRLIVVAYNTSRHVGKKFRIATKKDEKIFEDSKNFLNKKRKQLSESMDIDPVPNEIISTPTNKEYQPGNPLYVSTSVVLYGITTWGKLFNPRQQLTMIVFVEKVRQLFPKLLEELYEENYAKAITSYAAIAIDKLASRNCSLIHWDSRHGSFGSLFGRQSLGMDFDYVELNPFTFVGWTNMVNHIVNTVTHLVNIPPVEKVEISHGSAAELNYPDEFFDAVFTDPPYYDNIHYSVLSDFFYVWLKRSIGNLFPSLFSTPLTPKTKEAIADLPMLRGMNKSKAVIEIESVKTKKDFEKMLSDSFKETYRVLKNDGIGIIVYAHKSTEGWETLINSILESGLVITAAWPIHTEMKGRLTSQETAALSSSIYMVARKWKKIELGFYREVKKDLEKHVKAKLEHIWKQGISGADFFISAIGSSIETFGKYEKIVDDNDQQITTLRLLEDVRRIVTDFAIHQVLENGFGGEISQMSRLYILWRWAYGIAKVPFDDALKMTQSIGIDIKYEWNKGFIKKEQEFIKVLAPTERNLEEINSNEMIDVLHKVVILWNNNNREEMKKVLQESGFGSSDIFYKVAQAISEANPKSSESKLLDGFLVSRSKIVDELNFKSKQTKLL